MSGKKKITPFGSNTERFGTITLHPALDPRGLYARKPDACDPCLYHPKSIQKIFEVNKNRKITKDPWRYKKELEEWAKNLGYRNRRILDYRQTRLSFLGPAWHEISEPVKYESVCKNMSFGRTPRWKDVIDNIPPPGRYYRTMPFKAPYGPHSKRPTFEREEQCRFKNPSSLRSLPPNRYKINDKDTMTEKSKKIVSIRGPYDLFTGQRDDTTIRNHFGTSSRCSAATWPILLKGSFEDHKMSHFGIMNKTNRDIAHRGRSAIVDIAMALQTSSNSGPGQYDIVKVKEFKQFKYGFNSSYDRPPGYKRVIVWPGVGRYNIKFLPCGLPGHGHRHVFLSRQKRTTGAYIPQPMNTF